MAIAGLRDYFWTQLTELHHAGLIGNEFRRDPVAPAELGPPEAVDRAAPVEEGHVVAELGADRAAPVEEGHVVAELGADRVELAEGDALDPPAPDEAAAALLPPLGRWKRFTDTVSQHYAQARDRFVEALPGYRRQIHDAFIQEVPQVELPRPNQDLLHCARRISIYVLLTLAFWSFNKDRIVNIIRDVELRLDAWRERQLQRKILEREREQARRGIQRPINLQEIRAELQVSEEPRMMGRFLYQVLQQREEQLPWIQKVWAGFLIGRYHSSDVLPQMIYSLLNAMLDYLDEHRRGDHLLTALRDVLTPLEGLAGAIRVGLETHIGVEGPKQRKIEAAIHEATVARDRAQEAWREAERVHTLAQTGNHNPVERLYRTLVFLHAERTFQRAQEKLARVNRLRDPAIETDFKNRVASRIAHWSQANPENVRGNIRRTFVRNVFRHLPHRVPYFTTLTQNRWKIVQWAGRGLEATIGTIFSHVIRGGLQKLITRYLDSLTGDDILRYLQENRETIRDFVISYAHDLQHPPEGVNHGDLPAPADFPAPDEGLTHLLGSAALQIYRVLKMEAAPAVTRQELQGHNAEDPELEWVVGQTREYSRAILNQLSSRMAPEALLPRLNEALVPQGRRVGVPGHDRPVEEHMQDALEYLLRTTVLEQRVPLIGRTQVEVGTAARFAATVFRRRVLGGEVLQRFVARRYPNVNHVELVTNPRLLPRRATPLLTRGFPNTLERHPEVAETMFIGALRILNAVSVRPPRRARPVR